MRIVQQIVSPARSAVNLPGLAFYCKARTHSDDHEGCKVLRLPLEHEGKREQVTTPGRGTSDGKVSRLASLAKPEARENCDGERETAFILKSQYKSSFPSQEMFLSSILCLL